MNLEIFESLSKKQKEKAIWNIDHLELINLTGLKIPQFKENNCHEINCQNIADTIIYKVRCSNKIKFYSPQYNICMKCFKRKIESVEWIIEI